MHLQEGDDVLAQVLAECLERVARLLLDLLGGVVQHREDARQHLVRGEGLGVRVKGEG